MTYSSQPIIQPGSRVAVIGAGAAGLHCAKQLRASGYDVCVFEKSGHVGGIWDASLHTESPVYSSLKTNLPKYVMKFGDDEYPESHPSFLTHGLVIQYLQSFCTSHCLDEIIHFHHHVIHVHKNIPTNKWVVLTKSEQQEKEWQFDAVFICSGHYVKPLQWNVKGHDNLKKNNIHVEHSVSYKHPDEARFRGRNVAVIGAGPSGVEISLELTKTASHVYLSKSNPGWIKIDKPSNFTEVCRISQVLCDGTLELESGELLKNVDCIVTCTGFRREYSYLQTDAVHLSDDDVTIFGLLKHCVCMADPTLVFIGVPTFSIPFPTIEYQTMFAISVLQRKVITQRKFETLVEEEEARLTEFREHHRGKIDWWKGWHVLGLKHWDYISDLSSLSNQRLVPQSVIELCKFCIGVWRQDPVNYREMQLEIHGEQSGMWSATNVKCAKDIRFGKEVK